MASATKPHQPPQDRVSPDVRQSVLGIGVSAARMDQAVDRISSWIARREQHCVTVTPAHAVTDAYRDPELRRIFNASGLTTPDGMAIVWILRLRGHRRVERVYGPDLMLDSPHLSRVWNCHLAVAFASRGDGLGLHLEQATFWHFNTSQVDLSCAHLRA